MVLMVSIMAYYPERIMWGRLWVHELNQPSVCFMTLEEAASVLGRDRVSPVTSPCCSWFNGCGKAGRCSLQGACASVRPPLLFSCSM